MKRVLVIEDDDNNMELISLILETDGYRVLKETSGSEGVESAASGRPDFIILDVQLPDIDGFEVLRLLREREETRDIPVVAMTSFAMTGDKEKLLGSGCAGYIEKPIDPATVIEQLKTFAGDKA